MQEGISIFLNQFMKIPEDLITLFKEQLEPVSFQPLDFLAKRGRTYKHFYIIESGIVRSYTICPKGKDRTRNFFKVGNITGPISAMMQQKPADLNHQALTEVNAYRGDFYLLRELTQKHHGLSRAYVRAIQDAYVRAEQNLLDISRYNASKRYLMLKEDIPNIEDQISQKYIASYLNITPVQLSRIRKKLINDN